MTQRDRPEAFDEKAALPELERLRDAIQAARAARRQKSEEFDRFVRSFREPAPAELPQRVEPQPPAPPAAVAPPQPPPAPSREPIQAKDTAPELPVTVSAFPTEARVARTVSEATPEPPPPLTMPPRRASNIPFAAAAALVLLIAVGFLWSRSRTPEPAPAAVPAASSPAPAAAPPEARPQAPASAPAPAALARPVMVDLRTTQPVWMRAVVDGEKQFEKMIPAGQSLQFGGDRAIAIRVGDGGAVLVKAGSREEPFGAAGQPLTRTFLPAQRGAAPR